MPAIIDMHMHTVLGAYDSSLRPEHLASEATRVGLSGVNITEHDRLWDRHTLSSFRTDQTPLFVNNGMEVSTDMGHIIAVGLPEYFPGIRRLAELRRIADETGAFLIVAHPFRHFFEAAHFMRQGKKPPELVPEILAKMPVFEYVHAIEALNGVNTPRENLMALEVAKLLGKPVSGGSDCHSTQGIGYYCTAFEEDIETPEDMLTALHAGRFHAAHGLASGDLTLLTETSLDDNYRAY
ncbi:MAG TPA: PHP-associated domain-containing protein [Dehalococcoidia bacterium]|nr:PHP-associated domain-containing protein [Dehalococcoidia bacterium]